MVKKPKERRKVDFGEPCSEVKQVIEFLKMVRKQKALRAEGEGVSVSVLREAYSSVDEEMMGNTISEETNRRLLVLMDHYGIKREPLTGLAALGALPGALSDLPNYFRLALRMAQEFHGLSDDFLTSGRGAPKKSFLKKKEFVLAVDVIMNDKQIGISAACEILRKRPGKWQGKPREALERQYHRERREVTDKYREDDELYRIAIERLEEKNRKVEAEIAAYRPAADEN